MLAAVTRIFVLFAAVLYVLADPNPNNPGPGDVFIQGQTCTTSWDVDSTGLWKNMEIDLMTGDNFNMVFLTTVANVDGTDPTKNSFSFTCPQVTPHSPIYFYQFSSSSSSNKTWTGRFTITDSVNDVVAPPQSTQPDGTQIPWGTGSLVNASASSPASATSSAGGTSVVPSSSAPSVTTGLNASPAVPSPSSASSESVVYLTTNVVEPTSSASAPTSGTSGAIATRSVSKTVFQTGLALGLAAFGFAVMF